MTVASRYRIRDFRTASCFSRSGDGRMGSRSIRFAVVVNRSERDRVAIRSSRDWMSGKPGACFTARSQAWPSLNRRWT